MNDVVYAADLWNLVLDFIAYKDVLPMIAATPPYFIAHLVWGSVFIDYLNHSSLIPSSST
jgi:hypothetical protein